MADPDRVRTKLGHLGKTVAGLTAKQDSTLAEYRNDPDLRDIVERRFVSDPRHQSWVADLTGTIPDR